MGLTRPTTSAGTDGLSALVAGFGFGNGGMENAENADYDHVQIQQRFDNSTPAYLASGRPDDGAESSDSEDPEVEESNEPVSNSKPMTFPKPAPLTFGLSSIEDVLSDEDEAGHKHEHNGIDHPTSTQRSLNPHVQIDLQPITTHDKAAAAKHISCGVVNLEGGEETDEVSYMPAAGSTVGLPSGWTNMPIDPKAPPVRDLLFTDAITPAFYAAREAPLAVWIMGKHPSATNLVASEVAKQLGAKLITRDSVVAFASSLAEANPEHPDKEAITAVLDNLSSGTPVAHEDFAPLVASMLGEDSIRFHGYVMAGQPCSLEALSKLERPELEGVWPATTVVDLQLSDADVVDFVRRARQPPVPIKQAIVPIKVAAPPKGGEDEEPDEEAIKKAEDDAKAAMNAQLKPVFAPRAPCDPLDDEALALDLKHYGASHALFHEITEAIEPDTKRKLVQLDALQPVETLTELVLEVLGQSRHYAKPQAVALPEGLAADAKELAPVALQSVAKPVAEDAAADPADAAASAKAVKPVLALKHNVGVLNRHCPVTFTEANELVKGDAKNAVTYRGTTVFLKDAAAKEKYLANPLRYSAAPMLGGRFTLALCGASATGKTAVTEKLVEHFGFKKLTAADEPPAEDGFYIVDGLSSAEDVEAFKAKGHVLSHVVNLAVTDMEVIGDRVRGMDKPSVGPEVAMDKAHEFQDKNIPAIKAKLKEANIKETRVDASKDLPVVLNAVRAAIDPFFSHRLESAPRPLNAAEKAAPATPESLASRELCFNGVTFCPVCLIDRVLLVPSKVAHSGIVCNNQYSMCGEECLHKFMSSGNFYNWHARCSNAHIGGSDPRTRRFPKLPQPRVLLVGPQASGKSAQATALAKLLGGVRTISLEAEVYPRLRQMAQEALDSDNIRVSADQSTTAPSESKKHIKIVAEDKKQSDDAKAAAAADNPPPAAKDLPGRPRANLIAFLEASEDSAAWLDRSDTVKTGAFHKALTELLATKWFSPQTIDELIRAVLAGESPTLNNDGRPTTSTIPAGYVCEIDVTNATMVSHVKEVCSTQKEAIPHCVLPFDVPMAEAIGRLLRPAKQQQKEEAAQFAETQKEEAAADPRPKKRRRKAGEEGEEEEEVSEEDRAILEQAEANKEAREQAKTAFKEQQGIKLTEATATFTELFKASQQMTLELTKGLADSGVLVLPTIDCTLPAHKIPAQLRKRIAPMRAWVQSLLQPIYPLPVEDAKSLTASGMKCLRRYGTYCPVCLADEFGRLQDCYGRPDAKANVWSDYVLYVCGGEHDAKFQKEAAKYLAQAAPTPRVVPMIAIIGPALSYKTTLASRLSEEYGMSHLVMEEVLEQVSKEESSLGEELRGLLLSGSPITDELQVRCIHRATGWANSVRNGWVLDSFPRTERQAELMKEMGVVPQDVFAMQLGSDEATLSIVAERTRAQKQRQAVDYQQLAGKAGAGDGMAGLVRPERRLVGHPQAEQQELVGLRGFYESNYDNLYLLDSSSTPWDTTDTALAQLRKMQDARTRYKQLVARKEAAPVQFTGFTKQHIRANMSAAFKDYCPVCWGQDAALRRSKTNSKQFAVEYLGEFFTMCGEDHRSEFESHPEGFTSEAPEGKDRLPEHLPMRVALGDCQRIKKEHCSLAGNCPVTLVNSLNAGGPVEAIAGHEFCAISYKGRIYRCLTQAELAEFEVFPDKYCANALPAEMPPIEEPVEQNEMLALHKQLQCMEGSVKEMVVKALATFESERPKFPGLSVAQSALLRMACYLKANNSKSAEHTRQKYAEKLQEYEADCSIVTILGAFCKQGTLPSVEDLKMESPQQSTEVDEMIALPAHCVVVSRPTTAELNFSRPTTAAETPRPTPPTIAEQPEQVDETRLTQEQLAERAAKEAELKAQLQQEHLRNLQLRYDALREACLAATERTPRPTPGQPFRPTVLLNSLPDEPQLMGVFCQYLR